MLSTATVRSRTGAAATLERDANLRRGLTSALHWAQERLDALRPEDYRDERVFRTVLTRRRKAVHRVERLLQEFGGRRV